ncbi:hypothetical protein [Roseiarcus sp.]|jgi:hypothetical protein|uniref:hypothetical protein n=1 Tax=Roseiarcus sp. TaxID=1969460 RepID=UPI003F967B7E
MDSDTSELDQMQADYKKAVEDWIAAIRKEEALASVVDHSTADLDAWEEAGFEEHKAQREVIYRKKLYEDALREELFGF